MAERLRKFIARSPRYVLRPQDRSVMRYSLASSQGPDGIHEAILINLSETGVGLLLDRSTNLKLFDKIKVEIPIPEGDQLAWWAKVVRLQQYEPPSIFKKQDRLTQGKILVGLKFDELREPHSRAIRRGLEKSFMQIMRDQQFRTWLYYRGWFTENVWKAIFYAILTVLAFGFLYWISRPDANYDAKRGAPWGERFKF